jgi:hypothetical protein
VAFCIQEKIQVGTVDCRKYNLYGYGGRDVLWIMKVSGFFLKDARLGIVFVVNSTLDNRSF